ncbi:MAG TPA: tetratricopeptide repeat protein [Campylobacterales bacterium]|nr:tetratricopeptide repeat protein [Campylobacterales bacterium]
MRIIVLISLFFSFLHSLEIDIDAFKKEALNDPTNINARLVLARAYIKKRNFNEAKIVLSQILALETNHQKAKLLMNEIKNETIEHSYIEDLKERGSVDSALNLYNLYIKEGRKDDAKKLKMRYWRKSINNPIYQALQKKDQEVLFVRADKLEAVYKKSKSFEDFKKYYYELEGLGYEKLGFTKLERFVSENKLNENAVLFLANQYYWTKRSDKSLKVLKPVIKRTKNSAILILYKKLVPKPIYKTKLNSKYRAETYFLKKQYLKSIPHTKHILKKSKMIVILGFIMQLH